MESLENEYIIMLEDFVKKEKDEIISLLRNKYADKISLELQKRKKRIEYYKNFFIEYGAAMLFIIIFYACNAIPLSSLITAIIITLYHMEMSYSKYIDNIRQTTINEFIIEKQNIIKNYIAHKMLDDICSINEINLIHKKTGFYFYAMHKIPYQYWFLDYSEMDRIFKEQQHNNKYQNKRTRN